MPLSLGGIEQNLAWMLNHGVGRNDSWLAEILDVLQIEIPKLKTIAHQGLAYHLAQLYKLKLSPPLAQKLYQTLELFEHPKAIRFILAAWKVSRYAELEKLIRQKNWNFKELPIFSPVDTDVNAYLAFKFGCYELLEKPSARLVRTVITIATDPLEKELTEPARAWLDKLEGRTLLDTIATVWTQRKIRFLLDILVEKNHLSKKQPYAHTAVALHTGNWKILADEGQSAVSLIKDYLVENVLQNNKHPQYPVVLETAKLALQNVTTPQAQQAICLWILQQGPQVKIPQLAAVEAGFAPANLRQRAVFYFLTEQWTKYDEIDFDCRILRDYYKQNHSLAARGPINQLIRKSGQTKYLSILASAKTAQFTPEEAAVLVETLTNSEEWAQLWDLVFELPVGWSIIATRHLAASGWQPAADYEKELFKQLEELATAEIVLTQSEINQKLPLAILRAQVRVSGRVNSLAFAPNQPLIAIATGNGKVVLWNTHTAQTELVLQNFDHSVGQLIYTPENRLICGERTASEDSFANIYIWDGTELHRLGQHTGAVSALAVLPKNRLLSAGREGKVVLWDLATSNRLHEVNPFNDNWVRAIVVDNKGNSAIMLAKVARVYRTAFLENADFLFHPLEGIATCAVITPPDAQGRELIVTGRFSGGLVAHTLTENNQLTTLNDKSSLAWNTPADSPVQGLAILPKSDHLVIGSANGTINLVNLAKNSPIGQFKIPGKRLTSLHVSADGYTLAVGDSAASFSLWDLRLLELRQLYTLPLSQATPAPLLAIKAAEESEEVWPPEVKNSFRYIDIVLRQRFRYDIEVELVSEVRAGEFDIELSD